MQNLVLYTTAVNNYRTVIKTKHGRIIYLELIQKAQNVSIRQCYYIDRIRSGKYYSAPKKLITKHFHYSDMLKVIANELDRKYYDIDVVLALSDLSTKEFIQYKLKEINKGYKFLIFIGEGELIDGIPSIIRTRFKNRIHRSIYLEMQYKNSSGLITDCYYYDREYRERSKVVPETLSTVRFTYNRQTILNIVNNELNTAFTDIIFVHDNSLDINNKLPLCGYIL